MQKVSASVSLASSKHFASPIAARGVRGFPCPFSAGLLGMGGGAARGEGKGLSARLWLVSIDMTYSKGATSSCWEIGG
eukprot:1354684-Amorphochlora_amoeboformis.AAC.1